MASSSKNLRKKWLWTGGIGASLFGLGICGIVECGFLKHSDVDWYRWAILGTFSLITTIFGIVLLIKAGFIEQELKENP